MGDEQNREAEPLAKLDDVLQDLPLDDHVEAGGGLVHDHDLRIDGQGHGDHDPLPHPTRQLVRIAPQPSPRDAHQVQQTGGSFPLLVPGQIQVGVEHVDQLVSDA